MISFNVRTYWRPLAQFPFRSMSPFHFYPQDRGSALGSHARRQAGRGFTLVELLVVVAIMALLMLVSVPAMRGLGGAQHFTGNVERIAGILDQARAYAVAQDTYVWVAFYPYDPSTRTPPDNSGDALYVAVFASTDGTDPLNWAGTVNPPGTVAGGTTTIVPILQGSNFKQTVFRTQDWFTQGSGSGQIASLPSSSVPTPPASTPTFTFTVNGLTGGPLSLPASLPADAPTAQNLSVVQFTPSGAARVNPSPIDSIWIDFQPAKAKGVLDGDNIVALQVNGLTGLTRLYRK